MALKPDAAAPAVAPPLPRDLPAVLLPVYACGLLAVFIGERVVGSIDSARLVFSGVGTLAAIAATAIRFVATGRLEAERRRVERILAGFSAVGLVALLVYFATNTEKGRAIVGITKAAKDTAARIDGISTVAWIALFAVSLPPLLFGEFALAPMRSADRIESRRVSLAVRSGLTLAFAAVYCSLFTYAAGELEKKIDFSYYRTARPGASTKKIMESVSEPLRVTAFFPELNDVGTEVAGYLDDLKGAPKVTIESADRLLFPAMAKEAKVTQDGVIVLTRGSSHEVLTIGSDINTAGAKLKSLDSDFQRSLLKVLRTQRTAYLTVGHGELNTLAEGTDRRAASGAKKLLESQNYAVKELGLSEGLGTDIPADAHVVIVLGPAQAFLPEEVAALHRYADKGGKLFFALDPDAKADLAPLADVLDLTWKPVVLANDKSFIRRRYNESDHAVLVTNRFSSHASVSTLSRNSSRGAVVFPGAAALEKKTGSTMTIDFAVKSLGETFDDGNGNFKFDAPDEKRAAYNLAAAITKPASGAPPDPAAGKEPNEMRAFVLGDADAVSDVAFTNEANVVLFLDAVRWLGGEESFSGEVQSNEDVRIEHTKEKDVIWFYGIIVGAPGLVLALGIVISRRARAGTKRAA